MAKLPIYEAKISDEWDGVEAIALVDLPAVESDFMAFKKDRPKIMYSIQNEEQHVLFGVLMRADWPIYRIGASGYEYYIVYRRETVRQMAQKMLKDGVQNSFNVMHDPDMPIDGIECFQIFLKDTEKGVNPAGFEDIEDGSLFGSFKVSNEAVWQAVKDGTFKGFSIEGYFTVEEQVENKQDNKQKNTTMSKLKNALRKLLAEFGEIETDKGTLVYDGELEVGIEVTIEGITAPDGEYEAEDKVIVVAEGKVAEIREKEVPAEPEADPEEAEPETEVEGEDENPEEAPEVEPEVAEEIAEEVEEQVEENTRDLYAEIDALRAEIDILKDAIAEIQGKPVDPPAEEQFEAIETREKGKSRIEQRMAYLRK